MHQGYQFEFLRGSHPDPEVWAYSEDDARGPVFSYPHSTDWLADVVEHETAARAELARSYTRQTSSETLPSRAIKRRGHHS
jgi:hypothetical protein